MKDVHEIRRQNLCFLIEQYGSIANLNTVLGRARTDSTISQYKNAIPYRDRTSKRVMGASMARTIEDKLRLGYGWMDRDHSEEVPPNLRQGELMEKTSIVTIKPIEDGSVKKSSQSFQSYLKGIDMSEYFLKHAVLATSRDNLRTFLVDDTNLNTVAPFGSIVLIDVGAAEFSKDGIYLLKINGQFTLRRIVIKVGGSYVISNDIDAQEVESLEDVEIVGRGCYIWTGHNI